MTFYNHHIFLKRCYDLARLSGLEVGSNPKVGAVLVYNDKIIGEGRHEIYGGHHAEVNAIASVKKADKRYIENSTLYVSLEPCCITGKTPPCTNAILKERIKTVHVGTKDPFPGIAGNGIKILRDKGVDVVLHDDKEAAELIDPFKTFHIDKRPFITLKFAKSKDNFIGKPDERILLTNAKTNIYTHKLRAQSHAILVGTNTAILDNPSLTTRHYPGDSPVRMVIDKRVHIPLSHKLYSDGNNTVVFNDQKRTDLTSAIKQISVTSEADYLEDILNYCYKNQYVHLMVEGGAKLLKSFIKAKLWDRAVIIQTDKIIGEGVKAPLLHGKLIDSLTIENDIVRTIKPN